MLGLASCAAPAPVRVQPVQSSANSGAYVVGTIVAARPVDPGGSQNASPAGLDAVMAALQQPAPGVPFNATEFIVQRSDGNPISVVARAPGGSSGFSVGDQVEVVAGTPTQLLHRN